LPAGFAGAGVTALGTTLGAGAATLATLAAVVVVLAAGVVVLGTETGTFLVSAGFSPGADTLEAFLSLFSALRLLAKASKTFLYSSVRAMVLFHLLILSSFWILFLLPSSIGLLGALEGSSDGVLLDEGA